MYYLITLYTIYCFFFFTLCLIEYEILWIILYTYTSNIKYIKYKKLDSPVISTKFEINCFLLFTA